MGWNAGTPSWGWSEPNLCCVVIVLKEEPEYANPFIYTSYDNIEDGGLYAAAAMTKKLRGE